MFYKKGVFENFAIFSGKHLYQSFFLSCNFIKKETLTQRFSCKFCKIFKNTFFTEPLNACFYFETIASFILLQLGIACNFHVVRSY